MKSVLISVRGPIRAINVFFPRVERCAQLAYELRMLRGQIVPLARVRRHVEEVEVGPILEELPAPGPDCPLLRSEEHTSELQSLTNLVCRLLLEKKNTGLA